MQRFIFNWKAKEIEIFYKMNIYAKKIYRKWHHK